MRQFLVFTLCFLVLAACGERPRDKIRIVGSSTVYPFTSYAAEQFGVTTDFSTPIVESTGTGGGIKMFCEGAGQNTPDMANASRRIKPEEVALCKQNGVEGISEVTIGFDGIVLANTRKEKPYVLSIRTVFLALAKDVAKDGKLVPNPYKQWSDIDPALPAVKIEVYGPPPTSGTRDAFVEIVMEKGCGMFPEFAARYPDKDMMKEKCHLLREDGAFVDAGENDNIIVQKLTSNPTSLGIFGYSFLEQNAAVVQGAVMDGVAPDFAHIADGSYPVARSLYVYVKNQHIHKIPGMVEFLEELTSEDALAEDGYLPRIGLIPLPEAKQSEVRAVVAGLKLLSY